MRKYSFLIESYGSDIIKNGLIGGAAGSSVMLAISHLVLKESRKLKSIIEDSDTPEEALKKIGNEWSVFIDKDNINSNYSSVQGIFRSAAKIIYVNRNDPNWKIIVLKYLNEQSRELYKNSIIFGATTGAGLGITTVPIPTI